MRTADIKGREARDVRATFGDLPLVEARANTYIYVNKDDIEHAVPGDPNNCMFSKACKRSFGSRAVLFYPSVAYVDMSIGGERVVMRFKLPKKSHDAILAFDMNKDIREDTFLLKKVSKSQTLTAARKTQRLWKDEVDSGIRDKDPKLVASSRRGHQTRQNRVLFGIRDGRGNLTGITNAE